MILICLATTAEAKACLKGLTLCGLRDKFEILQTGMGSKLASKKLQVRLNRGPLPTAIISSGFAGGLDPHLGIGDWVCGQSLQLNDPAHTLRKVALPPLAWAETKLRWQTTTFKSVGEVLTHNQNEIANDSIGAIDMESEAWFYQATEKKIPFYIIRLVSDTKEKPIPEAIKSFSNIFLQDKFSSKLESLARGSREVFTKPKALSEFIGRSTSLLKNLAQGWREIAPLLLAAKL